MCNLNPILSYIYIYIYIYMDLVIQCDSEIFQEEHYIIIIMVGHAWHGSSTTRKGHENLDSTILNSTLLPWDFTVDLPQWRERSGRVLYITTNIHSQPIKFYPSFKSERFLFLFCKILLMRTRVLGRHSVPLLVYKAPFGMQI